ERPQLPTRVVSYRVSTRDTYYTLTVGDSDDRSFVDVKPSIENESMKWSRNDQTSTGKATVDVVPRLWNQQMPGRETMDLFIILSGHGMYKSFKVYLQVDENTENSTLTWTVEYDKLTEDVPDPDSLLEFAKNVIKYAETRLNHTFGIEAAKKVVNDIKIPQLQ
nr:kirola [Tanacetum cinerariifolium]